MSFTDYVLAPSTCFFKKTHQTRNRQSAQSYRHETDSQRDQTDPKQTISAIMGNRTQNTSRSGLLILLHATA